MAASVESFMTTGDRSLDCFLFVASACVAIYMAMRLVRRINGLKPGRGLSG
jgi:hypothetical protein